VQKRIELHCDQRTGDREITVTARKFV